MTDSELIERLRTGATWDDDVAAADRIAALTAERDYTEGTNDTLIALNQSLTADNARLREALECCPPDRPQMTGEEFRAAVNTWWAIWARPALTGKEPSHE